MKNLYILILPLLLFSACKENKKVTAPLPSNSIFNLSSSWKNQNGESLQLKDLQNKTLVVVMIYTSCKSACPILVSKMKNIESKISRKDIDNTSLVLISIDPKTDTPARLKEFARNNAMDAPQWIFLTSSEEATQEFANVLSMKYKKISPIEFSHSNIISVFGPDGQLVSQEEGNIDVEKVVSTVTQTAKASE
ncbi:MAG: SCO family protein [Chitinophagaceae bacterium]|nr:SCO family protein [Chitinophagaceae bacterium]MCA6463898.1 SCO family protein [Chitinophagaceae bacterium]MEA3427073.1 SCO family protein [Bacteroidota bacterium]